MMLAIIPLIGLIHRPCIPSTALDPLGVIASDWPIGPDTPAYLSSPKYRNLPRKQIQSPNPIPTQKQTIPTTIRVRVFTDHYSSAHATDWIERTYESHLFPFYGKNNRLFLTNGDDYTHVVLINHAMPDIAHIPKSNVIGMAHEPLDLLQLTQTMVDYVQKYVSVYFVGELRAANGYVLPVPFVAHDAHLWFSLPDVPCPVTSKRHIMSIMVSRKTTTPGHNHRHELVRRILRSNLPIDIYGHGCILYQIGDQRSPNDPSLLTPQNKVDPRLKGSFADPSVMLNDYLYHVCIESYQSAEYYSEKILDAMVRNTIPVYLGSPAIERQMPNMIVPLTGNADTDMAILEKICADPVRFFRAIDIPLVKKTTNLLYHLPSYFQETREG